MSILNRHAPKLLAEASPMMAYLINEYADKGFNYILSVAGGSMRPVSNAVRIACATTLLHMNGQSDVGIVNGLKYIRLSDIENIATERIVSKVILHMRFESYKKV